MNAKDLRGLDVIGDAAQRHGGAAAKPPSVPFVPPVAGPITASFGLA